MLFAQEFFGLNLHFARKISDCTGINYPEALLKYTHLYLSLGLDRDFNLDQPIWQEFLQGIHASADPVNYTHKFYLHRQRFLPQKSTANNFGCFSYAIWPGNRIRIHFRNAEPAPISPLSSSRQSVRLVELSAMFEDIFHWVSPPATAVGGSWLYHLESYRRLFPPEFLRTAKPSYEDYPYLALWGQFLDRNGGVRSTTANHFRQNLDRQMTLQGILDSFPYPVLRLESDITEFFHFYGIYKKSGSRWLPDILGG